MKNYVVFDPASGEILRSGHCQDSDLELQDPTGNVIEAEGRDSSHYVQDGQLVAYTDEQAAAKANRPSYPCEWSNTSCTWADLRDLDRIKLDQWALIKAAREDALKAGFTWNGMKFQSDPTSQQQIQGAVAGAQLAATAGAPVSITWTLADNTTTVLSAQDMAGVGLALLAFVQSQFDRGVELRKQIEAALDAASVQAITWAS